MDQRTIDRILKPFQRRYDCASVSIRVDQLAHVDVRHSIHSPRTSGRPPGIGQYMMSRPQD